MHRLCLLFGVLRRDLLSIAQILKGLTLRRWLELVAFGFVLLIAETWAQDNIGEPVLRVLSQQAVPVLAAIVLFTLLLYILRDKLK